MPPAQCGKNNVASPSAGRRCIKQQGYDGRKTACFGDDGHRYRYECVNSASLVICLDGSAELELNPGSGNAHSNPGGAGCSRRQRVEKGGVFFVAAGAQTHVTAGPVTCAVFHMPAQRVCGGGRPHQRMSRRKKPRHALM